MVNSAKIDLDASKARTISARAFAAYQTRLVEEAGDCASRLSIDLMFLAFEQVGVMEETHRMLESLGQDQPPIEGGSSRLASQPAPRVVSVGKVLAVTLQSLVIFIVATVMVEIIDPTPMGVLASTVAELIDRF